MTNPFESPDPNVLNPKEFDKQERKNRELFNFCLVLSFFCMIAHDTWAWLSDQAWSPWFYYSAFGIALFNGTMFFYSYFFKKAPEYDS